MFCCCRDERKEAPYYTYLYIIKDRQLFGNTISPPFTEDEKYTLIEIVEYLPSYAQEIIRWNCNLDNGAGTGIELQRMRS